LPLARIAVEIEDTFTARAERSADDQLAVSDRRGPRVGCWHPKAVAVPAPLLVRFPVVVWRLALTAMLPEPDRVRFLPAPVTVAPLTVSRLLNCSSRLIGSQDHIAGDGHRPGAAENLMPFVAVVGAMVAASICRE